MTTVNVQASGGDHTTIQAAVDAYDSTAYDIVINDSRNYDEDVTIDEGSSGANRIKITVSAGNRHAGVAGTSHARMHRTANPTPGRIITVSDPDVEIEWLDIELDSSDASDEAIRMTVDGDLHLRNNIIHAAGAVNNQDGVYVGNTNSVIDLEQNYIYGFSRGGVHIQNFSGSSSGSIKSVGDFVYNCGRSGESDSTSSGGLVVRNSGGTKTFSAFNTIVLDCDVATSAADFMETGGAVTKNFNYCIDSDGSIATEDTGAVGSLGSRTITTSASPGVGDWVIVNNITTGSEDLTLKDNTTDNDAQDVHAVTTDSDTGLTIPSTDVAGTSRPQNTNFDTGPFEVSTSADTNVTTVVDPLVITEQASSIVYDVEVTTTAGPLIITEQQATVGLDINVSTTADPLVITENTASITKDVTVTTVADNLILTEQQGSITLDKNITTIADNLIITEQVASIGVGGNINAIADNLVITENQSTISLDINVGTTVDSLVLTEQNASISTGINVITTVDPLIVTSNASTITYDVNVSTTADNIVLTENVADINTGVGTNIPAIRDQVNISGINATIHPGVTLDQLWIKLVEIENLIKNQAGPIGDTEEVVLQSNFASVGLYFADGKYHAI